MSMGFSPGICFYGLLLRTLDFDLVFLLLFLLFSWDTGFLTLIDLAFLLFSLFFFLLTVWVSGSLWTTGGWSFFNFFFFLLEYCQSIVQGRMEWGRVVGTYSGTHPRSCASLFHSIWRVLAKCNISTDAACGHFKICAIDAVM